ncbi:MULTISPECIES: cytochrome c [Halocynthiibacter]|uniref:Cytochrome c n=1 Tax=Halocynthiibacter halioticoli TaxID=2986804 RepID=A0AAE3J0D3_9RHOB|nr:MULTISPECIES: cytochrome c [Halocynthiibacter]MCV6825430.1 cytochrome c [Halocynthiibacter halioticoli]MCW4058431.1 cytochrome c [Halocynthiibacter sp. SDUM655004]
MKFLRFLLLLGVIGLALAWFLTRPQTLPEDYLAGLEPNTEHGETVFWAAGCASCHAAPKSTGDDKLVLSGGYRIESDFGTFVAPNISPSEAGIAGWSALDLANALKEGVSPDGKHLYPSFPYTTYVNMTPQDIVDLKSFLDTLPPSDEESAPHELGFPFNMRRGLGLWKMVNLNEGWVLEIAETPQIERGRYLVEALGHCAECHTPRDITGGLDHANWMGGAPNPSGKGNIPAIAPDKLDWSAPDIAYYLETGFTPEFDSAGGAMASVVEGLAKISPEDREAIAAYLKALP